MAELGRAAAQGMLDGGVLPVLKHIPGHGRATQYSHYELPHISDDIRELDACDFAPFRELNDLPMGMTAHLVYDAIDDAPATLSPRMMKLVRDEIGFQGLIMTDDISMKALQGSLSDLSRAALDAGCDVVLHCNGTLQERRDVAGVAEEMTDAAQARAEAALAARTTPDALDIPSCEAQLEALLDGQVYG